MPLIHDIQAALLDNMIGVGSTLLKLRFLASKLDANILEEWVQHETEGYPIDARIPDYRMAEVSYTGTFANMVYRLHDVSIPSLLIEDIAGKEWVRYTIREGLPLIDSQVRNLSEGGHFGLDSGNLKILLQDKIYENMSIIEIRSRISPTAFTRIQHAVRAKALDFALKIEKQVPAAAEITTEQTNGVITPSEQETVNHLTQHIIYGDVTNINVQSGSEVRVNVIRGNTSSLVEALRGVGFSSNEAKEFAEIAGSEKPQDEMKSLGKKAQEWLSNKVKAGAAEAWELGKSVSSDVISEILKQFYGLS